MSTTEDIPEDFMKFTIEHVERLEDRLIISYDGRIFGGVMLDVLEEEISSAIRNGAELIARYHTSETGHPGQVAHMLVRHPDGGGWAEIYADWE